MNPAWLRIVAVITVLAIPTVSSPSSPAAEILCSEDFDGPAVKPGQSIVDAPLGWTLISPNDPAKQSVGNVLVGSGKYGWGGNYLDGVTATVPEAENVFHKNFPAVAAGRVVLSCRAFAPGTTSAGSVVSLRPAPSRFFGRGGGWISTADGWAFWVACANSSGYPLLEKKIGPCEILKAAFAGAHDTTVELTMTVDLDHNKASGQARWKDAQGRDQEFKSPVFDWDSAAGNVACLQVDIDKRSGHTGIAVDDLRVEGTLPKPQPHPFESAKHTVLRLDGDKKPIELPAEIQWISKSWNGENAQVPYLAYMPEKDRVLMLVLTGTGQPNLIASDDHGKTWSKRLWSTPPAAGQPDTGLLGLTYLGGGRLMGYPESLSSCWRSSDYGQTWEKMAVDVPGETMYTWDPLLVVRDADGKVRLLAQGCWKPTGIAWGSADGFYSQAYFRSSSDEGKTWSPANKIPQWLGVNEVSMIVARNGDWIAACRTDNPKRFAHHGFDHYSGLAVSISKDEGKTWSELNTLHEWGRHHPSMVLLPDGSILMSYIVRLGYPSNAEGFPQFGVEAVISRDNGQTWDLPRRYILAQWAGNLKGEDDWYGGVQSSSTVRLPDGTLLTAFGTGFRNAPGTERCTMDVALVRWRIDSPEK
jgi:hypothetical protein